MSKYQKETTVQGIQKIFRDKFIRRFQQFGHSLIQRPSITSLKFEPLLKILTGENQQLTIGMPAAVLLPETIPFRLQAHLAPAQALRNNPKDPPEKGKSKHSISVFGEIHALSHQVSPRNKEQSSEKPSPESAGNPVTNSE